MDKSTVVRLMKRREVLDRPILRQQPVVPEWIEVDEEAIRWNTSEPAMLGRKQHALSRGSSRLTQSDPLASTTGASLLDNFLALDEGTPDQIRRYANTWGVLGLCEHFVPFGNLDHGCTPASWPREGRTDLKVWHRAARGLNSLLKCVIEVRSGNSNGSRQEWKEVRDLMRAGAEAEGAWGLPKDHSEACSCIELCTNWFLRLGCVTFRVARGEADSWIITYDTPQAEPLLGHLAMQLALVVAGSRNLFTCHGCGKLYMREPGRRCPKSGTHNYCRGCGKARAQADAKRRLRRRFAEVHRLVKDGKTLQEIVALTGARTATVRRWLEAAVEGGGLSGKT